MTKSILAIFPILRRNLRNLEYKVLELKTMKNMVKFRKNKLEKKTLLKIIMNEMYIILII